MSGCVWGDSRSFSVEPVLGPRRSVPLVQNPLHTSYPEAGSLKVFFPSLGIHLPPAWRLFALSPSSEANSKWLDAHYDPMANIHTFSACLGESLGPGILVLGRQRNQMVL